MIISLSCKQIKIKINKNSRQKNAKHLAFKKQKVFSQRFGQFAFLCDDDFFFKLLINLRANFKFFLKNLLFAKSVFRANATFFHQFISPFQHLRQIRILIAFDSSQNFAFMHAMIIQPKAAQHFFQTGAHSLGANVQIAIFRLAHVGKFQPSAV